MSLQVKGNPKEIDLDAFRSELGGYALSYEVELGNRNMTVSVASLLNLYIAEAMQHSIILNRAVTHWRYSSQARHDWGSSICLRLVYCAGTDPIP